MASGFKVLEQYGEPIPTRKGAERVVVQRVSAGGKVWVEARIEFLTDGKWRSSKSALCFDNYGSLDDLLTALDTANVKADTDGVYPKANAVDDTPKEDEAPPVIPVVKSKARARAFNEGALVPE